MILTLLTVFFFFVSHAENNCRTILDPETLSFLEIASGYKNSGVSSLIPQETNTVEGISVYQSAPNNTVLVSFGGLHSFAGSFLSQSSGGLVIIHKDPVIPSLGMFATILLRHASSPQDYYRLFFTASKNELFESALLNTSDHNNLRELDELGLIDYFRTYPGMQDFFSQPNDYAQVSPFTNLRSFEWLKKLATNDKIHFIWGDIFTHHSNLRLKRKLQLLDAKIGLFDISNEWQNSLDPSQIAFFLAASKEFVHRDAGLIATHLQNDHWTYSRFSLVSKVNEDMRDHLKTEFHNLLGRPDKSSQLPLRDHNPFGMLGD